MKLPRFLIFVAISAATCSSFAQTSPGGVNTNLRWWLKADKGVFTNAGKTTSAVNNDAVQVWADQSGIANDATQATAGLKPTFRTNIINGYPVIFFDNTSNHYLDATTTPGIGATQSLNVVVVYQLLTFLTTGAISDGEGTFIFDRPSASNELMSFKVTGTNKYSYQRREDGGGNLGGPQTATAVDVNNFVNVDFYRTYAAGASEEGVYINGKLDVSQIVNTGNITPPIIRIGRHATDAGHGMNGYFAEIIIHNGALTPTERQKINSYIGIKYGLTVDQSTFTNYLQSDGTAIYSPGTDATYRPYISEIAGVGKDVTSDLSQVTGKNQVLGAIVSMTVENPAATLADKEFLVWGDNGLSLAAPNTTNVQSPVLRRLDRVWRVQESGDVGATTITFDLGNVPGTLNASDLRLMVNSSSNFTSGTTFATGTLAGRIFTVTGVNLSNGQYFTVGSINATTTPLPVELLDFKVTYQSPVVVATWKTASELNNDHFTLERSGPNLSFQEVAQIRGAGNSKTVLQYEATDDGPIEGLSYYRLKQTDHDGSSDYSKVKSVFVPYSDHKIEIFPNPTGGKQLTITVPDAEARLDYVEIINETGSLVRKEIAPIGLGKKYSMAFEKSLTPGLYLIRLRYSERIYNFKVMVQ